MKVVSDMARYFYDISGSHPFRHLDGIEHPNDSAAWPDALKLLRDAEEYLVPDGSWILTVRQELRIVYVIEVTARTVDFKKH